MSLCGTPSIRSVCLRRTDNGRTAGSRSAFNLAMTLQWPLTSDFETHFKQFPLIQWICVPSFIPSTTYVDTASGAIDVNEPSDGQRIDGRPDSRSEYRMPTVGVGGLIKQRFQVRCVVSDTETMLVHCFLSFNYQHRANSINSSWQPIRLAMTMITPPIYARRWINDRW